jgi:hypothetical protein
VAISRIISKHIPVCAGRDSRFAIRHNNALPGAPWWVYYKPPGMRPVAADDAHAELVTLVNNLKLQMGGTEGGGFSITEHGQVIARVQAPSGLGNAVHCIGVRGGKVEQYDQPLVFGGGRYDPRSMPPVGDIWTGPLCGTSYTFAAPGNAKPPSNRLDEVSIKIGGKVVLLSIDAGVSSYPPASGPLARFLSSLRTLLPGGGRFRVNEHGRAFTADKNLFIGSVPLPNWFKPLTAIS